MTKKHGIHFLSWLLRSALVIAWYSMYYIPLDAKRVYITVVNDNQQRAHLASASSDSAPQPSLTARPINIIYQPSPVNQTPAEMTKGPDYEESPHHIFIHNHNAQDAVLKTTHITPSESSKTANGDQPLESLPTVLKTFWDYKGTLCAATCALMYASLLGASIYYNKKIITNSIWGSWGPEQYATIPTVELAELLYAAVEKQYSTTSEYGFLTPVVGFLHDIDRDLEMIETFLTLHAWLERWYLSYLLPYHDQRVTTVRALQQKLCYFKEVLLAWLHHDTPSTRTTAQ